MGGPEETRPEGCTRSEPDALTGLRCPWDDIGKAASGRDQAFSEVFQDRPEFSARAGAVGTVPRPRPYLLRRTRTVHGSPRPVIASTDLLAGGGEMGALMWGHDWSSSPLGAPATWPQSLRLVVDLLLGSKFPMFVAWGEGLGFLYNDAYAEILSAKHR